MGHEMRFVFVSKFYRLNIHDFVVNGDQQDATIFGLFIYS